MATIEQVRQNGIKFVRLPKTMEYAIRVLVLVACLDFIVCDYCSSECHFQHCVCTETTVVCHNETELDKDIKRLFPCVKDHIESFVITGSHFGDLSVNFLGSCKNDPSLSLKELKHLDLSHNNIKEIHGKSFHCMLNLETLILAHNEWRIDFHSDQTGYFTSLPMLKYLDLTNAFDDVYNGTIHIPKFASILRNTDMGKLETLKLAQNELFAFSTASANALCELTSLKTLDLSHNKLSIPALPTISNCLEDLESLDVSYNRMSRLPPEFMSKIETLSSLQNVSLGHNEYMCDCSLLDTYHWLVKTRAPLNDPDDIICTDGYHSSYINKTVLSLKASDLKCIQLKTPSNTAARVVTGVIFTVIAITLLVFLVVHRSHVRRLLSKCKSNISTIRLAPHSGYSTVQEAANV